jgi:hypothetical protein
MGFRPLPVGTDWTRAAAIANQRIYKPLKSRNVNPARRQARRSLPGKARPLRSNAPPHARMPVKSGFPTILSARLPQERHFETGAL